MDEKDGKDRKTYVVGVLGEEHATWRMQSSKIALKIRLGKRRHNFLKHSPIWENFGSQNIKFVLERLKPSLYRRRTGHESTRGLQKKLTKVPL